MKSARLFIIALLIVVTTALGRSGTAASTPEPVVLNTNASTDIGSDRLPQLATDGVGTWVAVWHSNDSLDGTIGTDNDILVSRSVNNGTTWSAPAALNTNAATDTGNDSNPQVTTDGSGNWVAVWHSGDSLGGTIGTDNDILVSRSTNGGSTWTAPAALNDNAATDTGSDVNPQVTTDGAGVWMAVWQSTENLGGTIGTDNDILISTSVNSGAAWTTPVALNTNATTDTGGDLSPQVTTDGSGNWVAAWFSNDTLGATIGADNDILISRSVNNGTTWTAPVALNTNAATDTGGDQNPQVTTDSVGNWVAVWYSNDSLGGTIGTDNDILISRSTNNGAAWTAPVALNTNAATDTGHDFNPQVTTDGSGNWAAAWDSTDTLSGWIGTDSDVLAARSTNNGANWTDPIPLNTNADTDSGGDFNPQVTTDGSGNWTSVWDSNDDLGGTIDMDYDILYTTCSLLDSDCDEVPDATDNCPQWPNQGQSLPPWTIPADDPDCDSFGSTTEKFIGTLHYAACPNTSVPDDETDAWAPDFNDDKTVNVVDIGELRPVFGSVSGDGTYDARADLNMDGYINIVDVGTLRPYFNLSCT